MAERYIVRQRQVWIRDYEVEANSVYDAKIAVENGVGEEIEGSFFLSHKLPNETTVIIANGPRLELVRARQEINERSPYTAIFGGSKSEECVNVDCEYEDVTKEEAFGTIINLIGIEKYNISIEGRFIVIRLKP